MKPANAALHPTPPRRSRNECCPQSREGRKWHKPNGLRDAGHSYEVADLHEAGFQSEDRLLGVGVKEARMEILGGMMRHDDIPCEANLRRAYELGLDF